MEKVKSLADLMKLKEQLQSKVDIREKGDNIEALVQVKVAMATCGIAAGAKKSMDAVIDEAKKLGLNNLVVTQTGCMGYCYAEPTMEITLPGKEGVVFGHVDEAKAREIVAKYIKEGTLIDGMIPVNYKTV